MAIPALTRQHADLCLLINAAGAFALASATLTKGMKELKLSGSNTCSIYLGDMLDVLGRALLRAHDQPGMDWVLNPRPIFAIKLGGKMSGAPPGSLPRFRKRLNLPLSW